jgi:hypothetical protein
LELALISKFEARFTDFNAGADICAADALFRMNALS